MIRRRSSLGPSVNEFAFQRFLPGLLAEIAVELAAPARSLAPQGSHIESTALNSNASTAGLTPADSIRALVPAKLKSAIVSLLTSHIAGRFLNYLFSHRIPHRGTTVNTAGVSPRTAASLFFNLYERAEIAMIERFLPSNLDVVELGSSLGITTSQIARRLKPGRKLIAVEADPILASTTDRMLRANGLEQRVLVVPMALAYHGQPTAQFSRNRDSLSGRLAASDAGADSIPFTVPTTTLSKLVAEHSISDFVLVSDVEGAEVPLFLHDQEALARCKLILIEMDGGRYDGKFYAADDVRDLIVLAGFELVYRYGNCATFRRTTLSS